ncbi:hypothetical protein BDQ17DRAFT_269380 [Cyathus striatus]|nr:hypothetical protein BDQ17DRAFT_269380 [Cyathus striatus]
MSRSEEVKDPEMQVSLTEFRGAYEHADDREPWCKNLLNLEVEARGIQPIPQSERTDAQFSKIFFIWFSANVNVLTTSSGSRQVRWGLLSTA